MSEAMAKWPSLTQHASASIEEMTEVVSGFARIDHGRGARTGLPEVIFGEGKTTAQVRVGLEGHDAIRASTLDMIS